MPIEITAEASDRDKYEGASVGNEKSKVERNSFAKLENI
jgi:hypothetical protein